jgi:molybdate transport system substrate-binding protein
VRNNRDGTIISWFEGACQPEGDLEMSWSRVRRRSLIFFWASSLMCALAVALGGCRDSQRIDLTISAAASLQGALGEVEAAYFAGHPQVHFRNNFGSSGTLAREIEQGAPVDVFLSAAAKPMDDMEGEGLMASGTRRNILRNSLVLIAPLDSKLKGLEELADRSTRLIAMGDPASVPAGEYAQQTLNALQLNDKVKGKIVLGKDVRQVLTYVETGNADAGFVYATDARTSGRVRVVSSVPESEHEPIVYPAAVVKTSAHQEAARTFVEFLGGPEARAIFTRNGYTLAAP